MSDMVAIVAIDTNTMKMITNHNKDLNHENDNKDMNKTKDHVKCKHE